MIFVYKAHLSEECADPMTEEEVRQATLMYQESLLKHQKELDREAVKRVLQSASCNEEQLRILKKSVDRARVFTREIELESDLSLEELLRKMATEGREVIVKDDAFAAFPPLRPGKRTLRFFLPMPEEYQNDSLKSGDIFRQCSEFGLMPDPWAVFKANAEEPGLSARMHHTVVWLYNNEHYYLSFYTFDCRKILSAGKAKILFDRYVYVAGVKPYLL